jgi:L-arabinonolactonase
MADVECIWKGPNILGEGPIWNWKENALYWVDSDKPAIHRLEPASGAVTTWPVPEPIGSVVMREKGGVVAGLQDSGFSFIDLDTGTVTPIANPEAGIPARRLNDGKCDRAGRYWSGTMDLNFKEPVGSLYRLGTDLACTKMDSGVYVSNGIAWSPDNRTMYYSDSRGKKLYAYDFDLATGAIENRRVWVSMEGKEARIDGATVDSAGFYWCAHINGWEVAQYDPAGKLARTIKVPVRYPTMCTFGGPDLDVLYVTSLSWEIEPGDRERSPLSGALFAIHGTGATGLPEPFFAG